MGFIEKKNPRSYLLHIYAKPNSKKQDILDDDNYLIIYLQSKATQNKANKELISYLRKKLNISNVQLVSGAKVSNKLIQITFSEEITKDKIIEKLLK